MLYNIFCIFFADFQHFMCMFLAFLCACFFLLLFFLDGSHVAAFPLDILNIVVHINL